MTLTTGVRVAVAGDTMLGRDVGAVLGTVPPQALFARELVALLDEADLLVVNLECCISSRGTRWPDPAKPFFFRAPPAAVDVLVDLGVDCVTLANNHALDFGPEALVDTLDLLEQAGVGTVGAGRDLSQATRPLTVVRNGLRLRVVGLTDHPQEYAATAKTPGVAFADLRRGVPGWVLGAVSSDSADSVLVSPHWGPNMTEGPVPHVREAARALRAHGADLVAGHSAHVFHGVSENVIYDLGDFIDDYAVDPLMRNDLGLLFFVDMTSLGPVRLEAVPLKLDYCHTGLAGPDDVEWIRRRFVDACATEGTEARYEGGRLIVEWDVS